MDKYIIDGQELDYEAFQAYIKEKYNYDSAEDYLAAYDVEIVKTRGCCGSRCNCSIQKTRIFGVTIGSFEFSLCKINKRN